MMSPRQIIWLLVLLNVPRGAFGNADDQLSRLKVIWSDQRAEVLTARIKYRIFQRGVGDGLRASTPDEVTAFVADVFSQSRADPLRAFLSKVFTPPQGMGDPWGFAEFVRDGIKRSDFAAGNRHVFDGEREIVKTDRSHGSQVNIDDPAQSSLYKRALYDFRLLPRDEWFDDRKAALAATGDGRLQILLAGGTGNSTLELLVNPASGTLHRFAELDEAGTIHTQIFQEGIVQPANGPAFPRLVVTARYNAGSLGLLTAISIDEVVVNEEVSEDAFVVSGGPGTTVFDFRPKQVVQRTLESPAVDVANLPARAPYPVSTEPIQRGRRSVAWILLLNLAVISAIVVWVVYRLRR